MGYEAEIPPVPDRNEERQIIRRVKNSFHDQEWYRYFSPEAPRITKLTYGNIERRRHVTWLLNFAKGSLVGAFIAISFPPFFQRMSSGVPFSPRPKMIYTDLFAYGTSLRANWLASLRAVPLIFLFGSVYASYYTYDPFHQDEIGLINLAPR